ncbi:MAG: glycosyltransferase family 4 protein [Armatimonadetes bacterium]|nr:glycosyltransferase family 4 protein [Armatimonadota bacterium]
MKIALDGSLLGARFSGVERSVAQLIHHLALVAPEEHAFVVFVGDRFDSYRERYHPEGFAPGVEIVPCHFDNTDLYRRFWWQQVVLPRLCHGVRADVFHAPAYVAPAMMGLPHVVSLYDLLAFSHPEFSHFLNRHHYRLAVPLGLRRAQRVIVPSSATRRAVATYLPHAYERTTRVPLGVQPGFFEPPAEGDAAARESYNLPSEYLLWVGNVEPKKNVGHLFKVVRLLKSRGYDVPKLAIAGALSWGTPDVMAEYQASGLGDHVLFLGRVRDADLPAVYRGASAFLFPSLTEGFGLPPLEAMACGVPALVSDGTSLPEVVGKAGVLLSLDDVEQWADAVVKVLEDSDYRQDRIARGRSRAAEFTWFRTAQRTLRVYQAALQTGEDEYDHSSGRTV